MSVITTNLKIIKGNNDIKKLVFENAGLLGLCNLEDLEALEVRLSKTNEEKIWNFTFIPGKLKDTVGWLRVRPRNREAARILREGRVNVLLNTYRDELVGISRWHARRIVDLIYSPNSSIVRSVIAKFCFSLYPSFVETIASKDYTEVDVRTFVYLNYKSKRQEFRLASFLPNKQATDQDKLDFYINDKIITDIAKFIDDLFLTLTMPADDSKRFSKTPKGKQLTKKKKK